MQYRQLVWLFIVLVFDEHIIHFYTTGCRGMKVFFDEVDVFLVEHRSRTPETLRSMTLPYDLRYEGQNSW